MYQNDDANLPQQGIWIVLIFISRLMKPEIQRSIKKGAILDMHFHSEDAYMYQKLMHWKLSKNNLILSKPQICQGLLNLSIIYILIYNDSIFSS